MNEALGPKISPNFSTSLPSFSLTSNSKFAALLILANPKAITIYLDENHLQHLPHHLIPLPESPRVLYPWEESPRKGLFFPLLPFFAA